MPGQALHLHLQISFAAGACSHLPNLVFGMLFSVCSSSNGCRLVTCCTANTGLKYLSTCVMQMINRAEVFLSGFCVIECCKHTQRPAQADPPVNTSLPAAMLADGWREVQSSTPQALCLLLSAM